MNGFSRFMRFGPKLEKLEEVAGARAARLSPQAIPGQLKPSVDIATAEAADLILQNGAFERVFNRLQASFVADFAASKPGIEGLNEREKAHVGLATLEEIKSNLQAMADDLKIHRRNVTE